MQATSSEDPNTSIYDASKPNIYDTPRQLKSNLLKKNEKEAESCTAVCVTNIDAGLNPGGFHS